VSDTLRADALPHPNQEEAPADDAEQKQQVCNADERIGVALDAIPLSRERLARADAASRRPAGPNLGDEGGHEEGLWAPT
jgi:hypothetical protein